jgi:hypothetical protein
MPLLLSKSIEFQELRSRSKEEIELLRKLKDNEKIQELLPKTLSKKTSNMNVKPLLLILGHMMRCKEVYNPVFADSMDTIRRMTPQMIALLNTVALELQKMHQMGQSPKRIPSKTMEVVQAFQQHFIQGMWYGDNPLTQITHMNPENIKKYNKMIKEHGIPNTSIDTFCRLSAQKRSDLKLFTPKQLDDVEALVRVMPVIEVDAKAFVEGEEQLT